MQFHERLYKIRKRSGMTQNELAEKLNISRQAVSRWEMGTAKPDIDNLLALSETFSVSTDYLLKGENERTGEEAVKQEAADADNRSGAGASLWLNRIGMAAWVIFIVLWIVFALATGEPHNGFWMTAVIYGIVAAIIGIICLIALAVREVLRKTK